MFFPEGLFRNHRDISVTRNSSVSSVNLYEDRFSSLSEDEHFCMTNVGPEETGLSTVIFVGLNIRAQHGPHIKVSTEYGEKLTSDGEILS